jgi:flavin-dependent dehydrogenase
MTLHFLTSGLSLETAGFSNNQAERSINAAGMAIPESGEGIRPAIESGLLAAAIALESDRLSRSHLNANLDSTLRARFAGPISRSSFRLVDPTVHRLRANEIKLIYSPSPARPLVSECASTSFAHLIRDTHLSEYFRGLRKFNL